MAEGFLEKILMSEIDIHKVINWLQTGSFPEEDTCNLCSRTDFVLYFISYLRNQTSSILQQSSNPFDANTLTTPIQVLSPATTKEKNNDKVLVEQLYSVERIHKTFSTSTISKVHSEISYGEDQCNSIVSSPSTKQTGGIFTDSNNSDLKDKQLVEDASSTNREHFISPSRNMPVSPISQHSGGGDKFDIRFSTPNNVSNRSFNNQSTPLSSFCSKSLKTNDFYHKQSYSTPNYKAHNYKANRQQQHGNCYQDNNSSNHNSQQSFERPSSHRTNICIGDFIVSNSNASDKSSGKKKKHKFVNLSLDENHFKSFDEHGTRSGSNHFNIRDENSFPDIGTSRTITRHQPRRRINPTRLNMSDQGNNYDTSATNNIKFGIKCDKSEQNEAFKNQILHPKEHNANFNTERNILKLEKEKLLQKFNMLSCPTSKRNISTLGKTTISRIVPKAALENNSSTNIISPDPQKVTNAKQLDILSFMYSVIMDLNLVVNFATEVNFLISLLVSQSTTSCVENTNHNSRDINDANLIYVSDSHEDKNPEVHQNDLCSPTSNSNPVADSIVDHLTTNEKKIKTSPIEFDNHCLDFFKLLNTIHNCVYFSLKTLNHQMTMLDSILDHTTMRMLQQNLRVKQFCPSLCEHLEATCVRMQIQNIDNLDNQQPQVAIINKNVCFITDTDSEENFQTQQSFYTFKKQRDLFYDIFRNWQNNHNSANWNFSIKMGGMIRTLLNMSVSPSNLAHLARLFREQLIATCTGRKTIDEDSLPEVAGVSADRLNKLAQRLVAAPTRSLANKEKPDFPDHQEFFRDFLIVADNTGFHQHVVDSLIEEIYRLNGTHFMSVENGLVVNNEIKMHFLSCVVTLQLLGKFLGLLMSLPYRNPIPPSHTSSSGQRHPPKDFPLLSKLTLPREKVLQSDIHVRYQTQPPINLISLLKFSKTNQRLILTIPWVVQLLSMLDYTTLRLPYYKNVLYIIFEIYKDSSNLFTTYNQLSTTFQSSDQKISNRNDNNRKMTPNSQVLLKVSIGWLLDLWHFPQNLFYSWIKDNDSDEIISSTRLICNCLENETLNKISDKFSSVKIKQGDIKNEENSEETFDTDTDFNINIDNQRNTIDEQRGEEYKIDFLELIDVNVILSVCPHLKEFKCLLKSNRELVGGTDTRTYRHITPVTSTLTEDNIKKNKEKQIQIQLEDWFLRSQSQSTSRVLRSVGERVGSALLRLVRAQIPHLKYLSQQAAQYHLQHTKKENVENEIQKLNSQLLKVFRIRCTYAAKCCSKDRVISALTGMLPPATAKPVFTLLVELSVRRAVDSVTYWLNNNTSTEMLSTEMNSDSTKASKTLNYDEIQEYLNVDKIILNNSQIVNAGSEINTSQDIEKSFHSGAHCVVMLKDLCLELMTGGALQKGVDQCRINLEECLVTAELCSRCTYIQILTKRNIGQLCLDIIILIISMFPLLLTKEVLNKLLIIWKNSLQNSISPDCNIDIPFICDDDSKKETAIDELALFQKYMCNSGRAQGATTDLGDVNESLALLEEENICIGNKSFDDTQNSKINDSLKILAKDSDSEATTKNSDFFKTILCSRNVMYLGEMGGGGADVWKKLSQFLAFLLKNEFITEDSLTEQCLAVYREEWPQNTLENLSDCIKDLSQMYKLSSEKLRLFLDFVAEFCHNISGDFLDMA